MTDKRSLELVAKAIKQQEALGLGGIRLSYDLINTLTPPQPRRLAAKAGSLEEFCGQINTCTKCRLHQGRNKFVFGVGNPNPKVMFVGEGPGRDEDLKGEPFVGRAGQLLDKILAAIQFDRTQIYIANVVKCRPPSNRDPQPDEMAECMPYLKQKIALINPRFICCLGRIAAQALLNTQTPLGKLRLKWHEFEGRKLMVTYHPAALLRFPEYKRDTWEDVQMLRREYDAFMAK